MQIHPILTEPIYTRVDHFYGEKGDLPLMYHLGFTDVFETEGKMNACFRRYDPWDAPHKYYKRYRNKSFPESIAAASNQGKPNWVRKKGSSNTKNMSREDIDNVKRHYAGMINLIDDWIGKMLDILDEKN